MVTELMEAKVMADLIKIYALAGNNDYLMIEMLRMSIKEKAIIKSFLLCLHSVLDTKEVNEFINTIVSIESVK